MKYCCECGSRLRTPAGRDRLGRRRCEQCGAVFYASPRLGAACIARWDDEVLLVRRGADPGYGLWSLPGGFVEARETPGAGASRELLEEAGVGVEMERPYALFRVAAGHQFHVVYLARLCGTGFAPGPEALEVGLFGETNVPWQRLAFASTRESLRRYFADLRDGRFGFLFADIQPFASATDGSFEAA